MVFGIKLMKKLVYGVGINDADYAVNRYEMVEGEYYKNGKKKCKTIWSCPYYKRWAAMLHRCYSLKEIKRRPTYKDCTVCEEWLLFSNFREWMSSQDWEGKHLDKDLLVEGNKVYSPETCVFIDPTVNRFLLDRGKARGEYLIGCWDERRKKFQSGCNNSLTGSKEYLGLHENEEEAHLAWKKRKHELACLLAESEYVSNDKVKEALRNRYKNYTVVEEINHE